MAQPTAQEQYMLELVNRARANPNAEAQRYGISLNQGLAAGTLNNSVKQPLVFNSNLIQSSRVHSRWMLDRDQFSHTGSGGSSAGDRMRQNGYQFTGSWTWGENIAWQGSTGVIDATATISDSHEGLFKSPGHRTNLLSDDFREVGIGSLEGEFDGYNALMTTQNFARSGSSVFLTGFAFTDAVQNDDFYTVGEGLGGLQVEAVRDDGQRFQTTTFGSGGYQLALAPGNYTVNFSGNGLNQTVQRSVSIGQQNVKLDLATDQLAALTSTSSPNPTPEPSPSPDPGTTSSPIPAAAPVPNPAPEAQTVSASSPSPAPSVNRIEGTDQSDRLTGTSAEDEMVGVNTNARRPGLNERDTLLGQEGGDRFLLGDRQQVYYNDGDSGSFGTSDYAYIADFNPDQGDVIQLKGEASDYQLGATRNPNLSILLYNESGGTPEVIGVIQSQGSTAALSSNAFAYV